MGVSRRHFVLLEAGLWVVLVLLLGGCQVGPDPAEETPEQMAPAPEPEPGERHRQTLATVEAWLDAADRALSDDRLLEPAEDNAHDRYRAALYLDPGNTRAQSGLQAIVLRYLEMARSAARRGSFAQSEELLNRAELVDPGNALVKALGEEILAERERYREAEAAHIAEDSYPLDPRELAARSDSVVQELEVLAKRVEQTREFVLIISRTDDEGRWIYQTMREAVPDYLLRGDINLGAPPRIQLLPPL